jgi:hypothetical protein
MERDGAEDNLLILAVTVLTFAAPVASIVAIIIGCVRYHHASERIELLRPREGRRFRAPMTAIRGDVFF